ncbi:MAG: hypothetical protein HY770_09140, partial [Chitinivibrionia bacterium]|nr:hypothetical protein [Chitinivibrionia bacterium]
MKALQISVAILVLVLAAAFVFWSDIINLMMPPAGRPAGVRFRSEAVSAEAFERIAADIAGRYERDFPHIEEFRKAGVLSYEGPAMCIACHEKIEIADATTGKSRSVDLMSNVTTSVHYRFYSSEHPNVYGFNGKLADNFMMGKINRPCPKPGSFAMTAWAAPAVLANGDTLSEGCGQCHIGGQPTAPLGEMMPGYRTTREEKEAIDCLICHAVAYDMNRKQVIQDPAGRWYWDQDRSMRAAMSATKPVAAACLRCHQHNMGGDIYIEDGAPSFHESLVNAGLERPRVKHPGSKRGTPYTPAWDVHAAAGLDCIECHTTEGHYIAKGTHTTTMMANDLPDVEVSCSNCHGSEPHQADPDRAAHLNHHMERIACQTCHIPDLHPDNATYRDFAAPVFEEHPGIWVYDDIRKDTEPG